MVRILHFFRSLKAEQTMKCVCVCLCCWLRLKGVWGPGGVSWSCAGHGYTIFDCQFNTWANRLSRIKAIEYWANILRAGERQIDAQVKWELFGFRKENFILYWSALKRTIWSLQKFWKLKLRLEKRRLESLKLEIRNRDWSFETPKKRTYQIEMFCVRGNPNRVMLIRICNQSKSYRRRVGPSKQS